MAETRRNLFKASILSTFGLASCEPLRALFTSSIPIFVRATEAPGDPPGDYTSQQAIPAGTKLLITPNLDVYQVDDSIDPSPIDTRSIHPQMSTIGRRYFVVNAQTFRTDAQGTLTSLPMTSDGKAVIQCWNEIGKQ